MRSHCNGSSLNKPQIKNTRSCSHRAKVFGRGHGFRARIRHPSDLLIMRKLPFQRHLMAVMSAVNPQKKNNTGIYTFKQDKAYYVLFGGNCRWRYRIQTDRQPHRSLCRTFDCLAKPHGNLPSLGKMVHAAEKLFGPYRWGRYDVLVLPPSFPYGGMENPNLTFLTPSSFGRRPLADEFVCA